MKKVRELSEGVIKAEINPQLPDVVGFFMQATKKLFINMEQKAGDVVTPFEFVQALRLANPQFDETDN